MLNFLSLDYGDVYIGLAISRRKTLALGFETWRNTRRLEKEKWWQEIISRLSAVIKTEKINKLIIGLPKTLAGGSSPQTDLVLSFIKYVKIRLNIPIIAIDERLTTKEAEKKQAVNPHQEAARMLLENYLNILCQRQSSCQ